MFYHKKQEATEIRARAETVDSTLFGHEKLTQYNKDATNQPMAPGEMKSLCDISLNRSTDQFTIWAKLPIVVNNHFSDALSSQDVLVSELKFGLVTAEMVYNRELEDLLALVRKAAVKRSTSGVDFGLPKFNRRHLVILIAKCNSASKDHPFYNYQFFIVKSCSVKKYSDQIKHNIERDWTGEMSIALNLDRIYDYLDVSLNTSFMLSCVAYCEMLDELRTLLKYMMLKSSDDVPLAYSSRLSAERALLPLQRLALHRSTLHRILGELPDRTREAIRCKTTLENINMVLDNCYEVLNSLHGQYYIADIENLLDFSSKLSSLKFRKQKFEQTLTSGDAKSRKFEDRLTKVPSDREALEYIKNQPNQEADIMEAMRSEILARKSTKNSGSGRSFNLIDLASDREDSFISQKNGYKQRNQDISDEDTYELIEVSLNSTCLMRGNNISGSKQLLHKSFKESPTYHQDPVDTVGYEGFRAISRKSNEIHPKEEIENVYEEIDEKEGVRTVEK
ncbi:hypothetical protein AAG570_009769 [Ranatra chinensis]|uniref:Uncharacterized protein n=1 Tax=Ranatra chinensis TaxID=642074 RepID=A0ABD0ZDB3_9HEMI